MRPLPGQVCDNNNDKSNYDVSRLSRRAHRNRRCDETRGSYTLYQFDSDGEGGGGVGCAMTYIMFNRKLL